MTRINNEIVRRQARRARFKKEFAEMQTINRTSTKLELAVAAGSMLVIGGMMLLMIASAASNQ